MRRWLALSLLGWFFHVYHAEPERFFLGPFAVYGPYATWSDCAKVAVELELAARGRLITGPCEKASA